MSNRKYTNEQLSSEAIVTEQNELPLGKTQKLLSVLPPVILILSNIFLFGPFTIYQGNLSEFQISFLSIIKYFLIPSLIVIAVAAVTGMALTEKLHKRFVSIVFVLGLLLWLQGNILVWNYGIIGKGDIDLTKGVWRGWVDTSVWVGLFALAVFLYKYFYRIARPASIALVTLEAVVLLFNSFQHPGIWNRGIDYSKPQKEIYEFSSKQNVIHVILDEFQSAVFQKIISADTAYYYNVFDGFTFFKETVSSFPSTMTSVPSIMSGKVYKNDIPITDFIDSVYDGKTIPNVLYDNGYDVDLAAPIDWYDKGHYTNWYYIPVPYGVSLQDYQRSNSVFMMSLVAFRCAPHFLKKELFNKISTVSSFSRQGSESYEVLSHYANEDFLQDMTDSMSVKRDKPLYKFFHLTTTHYPAVVNANCQYAGGILPWDWKNITVQAKCSLDHFIEFLNKLKSLGIYDSSLIILHADHGYYKLYGSKDEISIRNFDKQDEKEYYDEENFAEKVCSCSPLLAVKPPHTNGLLKISNAQTALTDIPSTITSLLHIDAGFTGKSVFDIDPNENRERRFNYYYTLYGPGRKYFETMDEYSIIGSLYDRLSWHLVARHFPPTGLSGTEKIDLGTNDSYRFLQTGWSYREKERSDTGRTYTWALGKSAIISLTLPKTETRLTANVKSLFKSGEQSVTVIVDGKEAGSWKNTEWSDWEIHSVTISADQNRPGVSSIEFIFSDYLKPAGKETRRLALMFDSITFDDTSN